jgi:uncharacterized protein YbjT (DUF2867 family)
MKAIVIGATGLTGESLVKQLIMCSAFEKVITIQRKKTELFSSKLTQVLVDFDKLSELKTDADVAFSCLGTTIDKAGSQENFAKIDLTYNLEFAKACSQSGVKHLVLMSSLGANSQSGIFYSKIKGQLEDEVKKLPFASVTILQPALLEGNRQESRKGELFARKMMKVFNPLFIGKLRKYRSIKIEDVAKVMVIKSIAMRPGIELVTNDKIQEIAEKGVLF